MKLKYKFYKSFSLSRRECDNCGASIFYSFFWIMRKRVWQFKKIGFIKIPYFTQTKKGVCKSCCRTKEETVTYFHLQNLKDQAQIKKALEHSLATTNKTIKRDLARKRSQKIGSKCPCGSGKKYKNCCKKKHKV